jgi:hypothetical protein
MKIIILIILIVLSLACGSGGGSNNSNSNKGITFKFKASNLYVATKEDVIIITEKGSSVVLWEGNIKDTPIVTLKLYNPAPFFVEVKRNSVKYLSTFISKTQIEYSIKTKTILSTGSINALTTLMVELGENNFHKYFDAGVQDFTDINYNNVLSDFVTPNDLFYSDIANKANAISLYYQILNSTNTINFNYNELYDVIIKTNDVESWRSKAHSIELPDQETQGLSLVSNLLATNKFLESNTHSLLKADELRNVFWKTSTSDNILNYIGSNIIINSVGKLDFSSGATIRNLNIQGNLFVNGYLYSNTPTQTNDIINYYTLDNTITNSFLLTEFDTITGNTITSGNIFLSDNIYINGNVLKPTNYYTLDNTITNNITQLTNTFLLTDFDSITGNTITSGNLFLSDNIYINGNVLEPTNYYTLDNTITNNITQLTNTFLLTEFDTITGNTITSGNLFLSDTTNSTSTSTGSITTKGGLGVARDIYSDGTIYSNKFKNNIKGTNIEFVARSTSGNGADIVFNKTSGDRSIGDGSIITFTEIGSKSSENSFWNGVHFGSPAITESSSLKYPRLGIYSQYTNETDPTDFKWAFGASNATVTAQSLLFHTQNSTTQTDEIQGEIKFQTSIDALTLARSGNAIFGNDVYVSGNILVKNVSISGNLLDPSIFVINSNNNISIGNVTSTSNIGLYANGTIDISQYTNTMKTTSYLKITDKVSTYNYIDIDKDGILRVNTTNESYSSNTGSLVVTGGVGVAGNLFVGGNISSSNIIPNDTLSYDIGSSSNLWRDIWLVNVNMASDRRYKEDIKNIENGLDTIMKLRPVSYTNIKEQRKSIGLIAQEVQEIMPNMVSGNKRLAINYIEVIPLLIKAIQEQQIEINKLKERLDK